MGPPLLDLDFDLDRPAELRQRLVADGVKKEDPAPALGDQLPPLDERLVLQDVEVGWYRWRARARRR